MKRYTSLPIKHSDELQLWTSIPENAPKYHMKHECTCVVEYFTFIHFIVLGHVSLQVRMSTHLGLLQIPTEWRGRQDRMG